MTMTFLTSWLWWLLVAAVIVTGFIQDVGTWFERLSGLKRLDNLDIYRSMFGGVRWLLFRWGGYLRLALVVAILIVSGWRAALVSIVGLFLVSFVISRISRRVALGMLKKSAANDFGGTHRLCAGCGIVWPLDYFALDASAPSGHITKCVACNQPAPWSKVQDLKQQFAP